MVKQIYSCGVCGKLGSSPDSLAKHEALPVRDWTFKGGELFSYGPCMGSGVSVALILEPLILNEAHVQRYSVLGLDVLSKELSSENLLVSHAGFPPINYNPFIPQHKMSRAPHIRHLKNQFAKVKELEYRWYEETIKLLNERKELTKRVWKGYIEKAFGKPEMNYDELQKITHSHFEAIQHFYPHIQQLSRGCLKEGDECFYARY